MHEYVINNTTKYNKRVKEAIHNYAIFGFRGKNLCQLYCKDSCITPLKMATNFCITFLEAKSSEWHKNAFYRQKVFSNENKVFKIESSVTPSKWPLFEQFNLVYIILNKASSILLYLHIYPHPLSLVFGYNKRHV